MKRFAFAITCLCGWWIFLPDVNTTQIIEQCQFQRKGYTPSWRYYLAFSRVRYTYRCGFVWWKACTAYRSRYRSVGYWHYIPYYYYEMGTCEVWCSDPVPECECSSLPNCDIGQRRCNSNTDQRCLKCKDDFGEDMQAYALLPRHQSAYPNIVQDGVCQPRCSWISNSTLCYPGECHPEGPPSTCNCTTGFSGVGCLEIDNDPEPLECWAKVIRMVDGNKIDWKEAECVTSQNETVYVNDEGINHIEVAWTTFFRGAESYPSRPVYVNDFKVGVLGSWSVYRIYSDSINSNSTNGTMSITRFCDSLVNASEANPSVGTPIDCLATEKTHYEFKDSDVLQIDTTIVNGGYVETSGYPDPDELQRYSYKGNTLTNTVTFTFDFEAPYHCSLQTYCHENLLDRSLPFTKQENLSISWSGWEDEVSYVHHYEINVLPSQSNNGYLKCSEDRATAEKCDVFAPMSNCSVRLQNPGVYCVLLTVTDKAGNHDNAMRYLMFDNVNTPHIDNTGHYPMRVESAAQNTSYKWITNASPTIQVKWFRHFANEFHKNVGLLNAIDDYSLNILPAYDELTGQPPFTRSREAIPNGHGIIKFEVAHGVDQQGGESLTGATEWFDINNVKAEEVEIAISHQDGDTIRIWIKGQDALENVIEDNVTVHSDSTPPEIGEMYLTRNGIDYLAVHNSEDLHEMRVIFDAFDDHSGLSVVHWELFDMNNNSLIHGEGSLPVVRAPELNECNPPECTCIPLGECYYRNFTIEMNKELMSIPIGIHDYDYVFSMTVTNNAMLQRTRPFQITVDNSPPHEGSVHDSLPDNPDVDFQQSKQIFASWDGFFDRESGIMLYVYYFGTDCLDDTDITFPIEAPLLSTKSTQAEWTAPLPDRYHCTVIAYNRAMEPSNPVCSDGVTVDVSKPIITDVVVDNIYTKAGLVHDGNGTVWFIGENRERQRVLNASEACTNSSRQYTDVALFPVSEAKQFTTLTDEECKEFGGLQSHIYMKKENHLSLAWKGMDAESGIFDYEVGLSSVPSGLMPDILPFISTKSHPTFLTYHPNLGEGVEFYIVIKAINRANLITTELVGPVIVEVTPPEFNGEISVTLERDDLESSYLVARWDQYAFYDDDELDPLEDYQVAVGEAGDDSSIMSYIPLLTPESGICEVTVPPSCVAVPTDILDWHLHGEKTYYISIKVTNVAGLSVVASSLPYRHVVLLPRKGVVYDIASPDEAGFLFEESEDIDFQTNVTHLHCRWTGFSQPYQNVDYSVALGTAPGLDDIVPFIHIGSSNSRYTFDHLTLDIYQMYFVTVKAKTEMGSISVSSDGVMVLSAGDTLQDIYIYDGLPCDGHSLWKTVKPGGILNDFSRRQTCSDDLDFQASVTGVNANWVLPDDIRGYITEVKWALQSDLFINGSGRVWDFIVQYRPVHTISGCQITDVTLRPGNHYRSIVQFCHPAGCFQPVASNGFWVTPYPPIAIGITEVNYESASGSFAFKWYPFKQEELTGESQEDPMDYYEWSINVMTADGDTQHGNILLPWQRINATMVSGELQYTTTLLTELDFSDCLRLGLRGYNKAGLSSTIHKEIKDCSVVGHITGNVVIDTVGEYDDEIDDVRDVQLSADLVWPASDAEYTRSKTKLSSVWPSLGHGNFSWKVISDQTLDRYAYKKPVQHIDYNSYPSSSPDIIVYGKSQSQYINVGGLNLQHGWRYYICIHANETVTYRGNIKVILPEVSACSDGIVADHTPPATGIVKIGREGQQYQTSTSELIVHWSGFYDVDEHGRNTHSSGIKTYEIAIGSSPGGLDARDYQSVGMLDRIVLTDLYLQGGLTYFATIRATDYVGLMSEAVSNGITVDVTPPITSEESLELGGHFLTSISSITASWTGLFTDAESGIVEYEWCVGSKSWHSDVYACTVTDQEESVVSDDDDIELLEGHVYYVMVKAYNNAGLSSAIASSGMLVDASAPVCGFIYDGDDKNTDKDHQTHLDYLAAHWYGFYDPHSPVTGYSWKIGSCSECDDVLSEEDVGLSLEMKASNLNLEPGVRYYTTVTACNAAGLCTTVTSDGIIPDNSPPIAGKVYDGVSHGDIAFQSSRTSLSAHWYNFHDPHSQLSHYELRAGTSPGGNDILPKSRLHLTEKAYISQIPNQLQIATPIYLTVTAFNKAGLLIEKSSNGMIVDDTPPTVKKKPTHDIFVGSVYNGTQVWSGLLSVSWEFHDSESPIVSHLLSVSTHRQSDLNVSPVKVQGNLHQYTFTNLSLHDGNTYYVHVIACNAAKLCTSSDTDDILVDSSPPTVGTFAVHTDHAAGLTRHREGWMIYHQSQGQNSANVKLAWLGFADIHTGIRHYHVGIGSRYASWDMTKNTTVQVQHSNGSSHFDEGSIQTATVDINRDLIPGEYIYCTLWAVNKVGLRSYEAHETFVVTKSNDHSGILSLLRRCDTQTCQGDCTCAPQNTPCDFTPENCNDVTGNNQYKQVQVFDIIDYRDVELIGDAFQDVNFTASRCALAGRWRVSNNGISIQRYEWSVGSKGDAPGTGLLNPAFDRIWHDAGLNTFAVFTARDIHLHTNLDYVFYVKAWYDATAYAVFASDGIRSDGSPPGVSKSRKVKDVLDLDKLVDTDYSSSTSSIGVSWKSIFTEADSEIRYFSVSIGTYVGGEDIQSFGENILASNEFKVKLDGLTLQPGKKYYCNVKAVNSAGLVSIASSDGFMVDTAPPEVGVVHDGLGIHDSGYQNSSNIVAASWHGFSDLQSSVHHYIWCVGTTPGAEDVLPCRDVGLHLSMATTSEHGLSSGQSYFSKVMAVDAAGLQSEAAISNGITVDTTVPEAVKKIDDNTNLIVNPSFEEVEAENGERDCTSPEIFICLPAAWQVQGTGHVTRDSNMSSNVGNAFMNIYGSVSQTVETEVGGKYRVSFYASHLPVSATSLVSQQGYIHLPGLHRVFKLFKRRTRAAQLDWYEHVYYFTAASELSNVTIGSFGDKSGIAINDVQLFLTSEQENTQPTDSIHTNLRTDGKEFSLHASWDITDPESPIVDYMVAIGTVKGGTQLQDFQSVGRSSQVFIDDLLLTSGLPIYVTVVAKNAADLTAVFYSEPIMVDITPPQLCCIGDGPNENEDLTHQRSSVISVHWTVSDPESGIEYCEWAVGRAPSSSTLLPYTRTSTQHSASVDLENHVHHADTVYCSIRCKNSVGLFSYGVSSGVTLVKEAPHSHEAILRVVTSSQTVYDARENHQTEVNSISIAWDGFSDLSGISHFECKLLGDTKDATQAWRSVGVEGETTAVMTGLSLKSYKTYQVQLRAVNYGGLKSEPVTSDVTIETCPPYRTGHDLLYSWLSEGVVHLDWSKLFISNSSLTYELSVGSTLGGGNILKWYETRIPSFQLNEVDLSIRYFVSIVAVNEAGLFEIYNTDFFPKHN